MGRSTASRAPRAWPLAGGACLSALDLGVTLAAGGLEGGAWWEGILGVILGLFVCSIPARHFLDLLIYWRVEGTRFRTRGALSWWVAANAAVLAAGWLVIVVGTTRFTAAGR
jgi:hypothetical protein